MLPSPINIIDNLLTLIKDFTLPTTLPNWQAHFVRAEKNVKELNISVDLMKKESQKLLERAQLAEKDMKYGHTELMYNLFKWKHFFFLFLLHLITPTDMCRNAGSQIQRLAKSVYKVEAQAAGLHT